MNNVEGVANKLAFRLAEEFPNWTYTGYPHEIHRQWKEICQFILEKTKWGELFTLAEEVSYLDNPSRVVILDKADRADKLLDEISFI